MFAQRRSVKLGSLTALLLSSLSAAVGAQRVIEPCQPIDCSRTLCRPAPCPTGGMERTTREVKVTLEGRVLSYHVTEKWTNRGRVVGEVDYVLPLPRSAAFDDLALEIDGEMITGEALDANRARAIYQDIVRQQKDPALVEWIGMGLLRTRIFPVAPGETRTVSVRFTALAEREGDMLRVDVPAPRGAGTERKGTDLEFGWPAEKSFGDAWSPTHDLALVKGVRGRTARAVNVAGTVTLLVPVRNTTGAAVGVVAHAPAGDDGFALITLTPPATVRRTAPRDVTFVLDVSGSMSGKKIEQARAAGHQLLQSLSSVDRFRLIAFAGDVSEFRDGWTTVSGTNLRAAEDWLNGLRASGGTNIQAALERALEVSETRERLPLLLFLTDGAPTVGERRGEKLAQLAADQRGGRRIFTFGIGADVNAALLEQLALDGAGTPHFVRPEEDIERVVGVVAQRLTNPVATDIRVSATGVTLHSVQPAGRVDLFAGQELTILARYKGSHRNARITISGKGVDGPVSWSAAAELPDRKSGNAFVGRLWATQRIGWLSAERRKGGASAELDKEIRELGERWGIPTEFTSYLVLEPGMTVGQPAPLTRGGVAMQGASPRARNEVTSDMAFESAKAASEMRMARSIAEPGAAAGDDSSIRRTTSRRFELRSGVWTDMRESGNGARAINVVPYSALYFELIEAIPELREVFAIGDLVQVHGRRVTLRLATDGQASVGASTIQEIIRDW